MPLHSEAVLQLFHARAVANGLPAMSVAGSYVSAVNAVIEALNVGICSAGRAIISHSYSHTHTSCGTQTPPRRNLHLGIS